VVLCFVPGVKWQIIILVLVLQKLAWAFNLAVVCGCVQCDKDGTASPSTSGLAAASRL